MSKIISISSQSHLDRILGTNTCVVADFYATWCGPCKAIAPLLDQLASTEAKPGRLAFVKVDVDAQSGVARKYGVSAMPTFLVLRKGQVVKTIQGANSSALRSAVSEAAKTAASAASANFSGAGHVLGNSGNASGSTSGGSGSGSGSSTSTSTITGISKATASSIPRLGVGSSWLSSLPKQGFLGSISRFFALYATTLFSLDPVGAAQASPLSKRRQ